MNRLFTSITPLLRTRFAKIAFLVLLPFALFQLLWRIAYYRPFNINHDQGYFYNVAFSPDGDIIASSRDDVPVQLWSYKARQLLATLPPSVNGSRKLQFMKDRPLLAASGHKSLTLWNLSTHSIEASLTSSINEVWSIDFSPDGTRMVVGGTANAAEIWDLRSFRLLRRLTGSSWMYSVAFSPDGDTIATGEPLAKNTIKVWNAHTGKVKWVAQAPGVKTDGYLVAFSPDGKYLAGGYSNTALWDAKTGKLLHILPQLWPAHALAFSSDSQILAVASQNRDTPLWLWNTKDGTLRTTQKCPSSVQTLTFWHNDRTLATATGAQVELFRVR